MAANTENKIAEIRSGARRSRTSASISKLDPSAKAHDSKGELVTLASKDLFEGRLGLMSSLRKGLVR